MVNSGKNSFEGTTVFLDADIYFPAEPLTPMDYFTPIGNNTVGFFKGTFDGQGHIINNLAFNTSYQYAGLFGYSGYGLTIRNVIMGKSCSITSSFSSGSSYMGGILGQCTPRNAQCNIENSINMGDLAFGGSMSDQESYLGGIAGYFHLYEIRNAVVKNCANYGRITDTSITDDSYIGGIVGHFYQYKYERGYIRNCLNYGDIRHNGRTMSYLTIGGITGWIYYGTIENCVSAGKISGSLSTAKYNFIGSLIGYVGNSVSAGYCHWGSDIGVNRAVGSGTLAQALETSLSIFNSALVSSLNNRSSINNWNKWLLNSNRSTITFHMNNNKGFSLSSELILLPSLAIGDSLMFNDWFTDPYYEEPFQL